MGALRLTLLLIATAATLAGCGGRRADPREGMIVEERADGTRVSVRPGSDPNAAYVQATELKAKGDCAGAVMLLRPVAMLGPGYENAQTVLGECLAQTDRPDEGVTWLTRAADAGWPEAQALLAIHFGGSAESRNGDEAGYWLALYDSNPSKGRVGFRPPEGKVLAAVRGSLTDTQRENGQRRAASWQRKLWIPPAGAEGTGLKPARRERRGLGSPPSI